MIEELLPETDIITGDAPRILLVEDDPQISELLEEHLSYSIGAEVRKASDAVEAMELDADKWAEIVIVDYLLPDMDGVELSGHINKDHSRPLIFMTGHPTVGCAIDAMRFGAIDMFVKPLDLDKLSHTISTCIEEQRNHHLRIKRLTKLRSLAKTVIRERRTLRRKLEFMCKDVVGSYRDLAERVVEMQNAK